MNLNLSACVITYEPGKDVIEKILTYYYKVGKVVIIDNSENNNDFLRQLTQPYKNIQLLQKQRNIGMGAALNEALMILKEDGYEWVLTMDQDSSFSEEEIEKYIRCFNQHHAADRAVFGINYGDKLGPSESCEIKKATTLITSGSIINIKIWTVLNGFNAELFIDGVDHDYCFRAIEKNYGVYLFENVHMQHSLGNKLFVRNWRTGKQISRNIHAPFRIYYITRNSLYLIKKYKKSHPFIKKEYMNNLFVEFKNSFLYNAPLQTTRYFLLGVFHFVLKRSGKL